MFVVVVVCCRCCCVLSFSVVRCVVCWLCVVCWCCVLVLCVGVVLVLCVVCGVTVLSWLLWFDRFMLCAVRCVFVVVRCYSLLGVCCCRVVVAFLFVVCC